MDCRSSGITIRPILDLVGEEGFNEITFDDVVPDSMLVGREGNGWEQATAELAFERRRAGEPVLVLVAAADARWMMCGSPAPRPRPWAVSSPAPGHDQKLSLAVAGMPQDGKTPAREAALVRDVGNDYEQALPETLRKTLRSRPHAAQVQEMQRIMIMVSPAATACGAVHPRNPARHHRPPAGAPLMSDDLRTSPSWRAMMPRRISRVPPRRL